MSESGEKYAQTKHMMFLTSENSPKRILGHIFMWEGNRGWGLFNGGNHIMDYWTGILAKGLDFYDGFVTQKHRFSLHKMLPDGLEWCGLLVDYCDDFISCLDPNLLWRHPFTKEDPLVNKWYNATFIQICPHTETNLSTPWIAWSNFYFWVNYFNFTILFKNLLFMNSNS